MSTSEQASEKVELADHSPGVSTFPGTRTRGGWIPILLKPKEGKPFISDWICPTCHRLTGNYRFCGKCGLEVMARPKIKAPLPDSTRDYQYRRWANKLFEEDNELSKPRGKASKSQCSKLSSSSLRSKRRRTF